MINLFVAILFACMCSEYFYIYFQTNTLSSAMENMPLSIIAVSTNNLEIPYIEKDVLEDNVNTYFMTTIGSFYEKCGNDEEKVFYTYGNYLDDKEEKPQLVTVTLSCDISSLWSFSKSMTYEIVGGE
ncbi:MAG: hypothetical protein LUB56_00595 [Coprobacillus sp.]|nr:hypothetical protein [Coprobacillus sp.]